jgi:hypothetical protein
VTLRDIFDGDPRSKSQLRDLLKHADKLISDLSRQISKNHEQANASAKEVADLHQQLQTAHQVSAQVRNSQIAEKDELQKRSNLLAQRESTLYKNFTELQRREELLKNEKAQIPPKPTASQHSHAESENQKQEKIILERKLIEVQSELDKNIELLDDKLKESNVDLESLKKKIRDSEDRENAAIKHGFDSAGWAQRRKLEELEQTIKSLQYEIDLKGVDFKIKTEKLEKSTAAAIQNFDNLKKSEEENLAEIDRLSEINERQAEIIEAFQLNIAAFETDIRSSATQINGYISTTAALRNEVRRYKELIDNQTQKIDTALRFGIPVFMKEEVLAWLFSNTEPDSLQVADGYLHLMGDGPWDNDSFGRIMKGQDFSVWEIADAEISHLVIGRNNWRETDLIAQIEARHGQTLRIYSQEMWFAAMATGRDPFDSDDPVLLDAFAKGHAALEFLISQEVPWPNISENPSVDITDVELGELGVLASPMHLMDYRVGKTSPHSEADRHAILDAIFSARYLPFGEDCSNAYRANWGSQKSAQRLYRMASHIKFIIDGPNGSDYRKSVARADWISDLLWLKKSYYRKAVHAFKWPNTQVP